LTNSEKRRRKQRKDCPQHMSSIFVHTSTLMSNYYWWCK